MNLKEQTYVCMLAQTGSITAAAKKLNISQPALTLYIQNLERTLGVKLFDRVGKRFVLTYPGQLYVDTARQMLALKETFDGQLSSIFADYSGRIRVGIQDTRSSYLFPRLIERFTQEHPNIELLLSERRVAELENMLRENELDMAFCNLMHKTPDLEQVIIHEDNMMFMTPKGIDVHPKAPREPGGQPWVDLHELEHERFLLQPQGYTTRGITDELLRSQNVKPEKTMVIQRVDTMVALVARGFGVGFTLRSYLQERKMEPLVDLYDVGQPIRPCAFGAVYLRGRQLPSYAQSIVEIMRDIMSTPETAPEGERRA